MHTETPDTTQTLLRYLVQWVGVDLHEVASLLDDEGVDRSHINEVLSKHIASWIDDEGNNPSTDAVAEIIRDTWQRVDEGAAERTRNYGL